MPDPGSAQGAEASERWTLYVCPECGDATSDRYYCYGPPWARHEERSREAVSLVSEEWHRAEVARLVEEAKREQAEEVLEAQADLQMALGAFRLVHGEQPVRHGESIENWLERSLARSHRLLEALGRPMYDPATHPEISASLAQRPSESGAGEEE